VKIVFWSNVRGQCGTTLHTACIATIQALFGRKKVVLMENHDHLVNIETCFMKDRHCGNMLHERGMYDAYGLGKLMDVFEKIQPGEEENIIGRYVVNYLHNKLFYLPHGYVKNLDLLEYQLSNNMNKLFDYLDNHFDTVYIDTFSADGVSARSMIENADIVVVNLNQNSNVLKHFFRNFSSIKGKCIYLLGNYYHNSRNSILEIRRKYQIPEERIYAIPYCKEAAEAESQGNIAGFIAKNYLSPSIDNKEFIESLHDAYNGIMGFYSSSSSELPKLRGLSLM